MGEVIYRCERCGALLDVEHDVAALRTRPAEEWRALFDGRLRAGAWPFSSGVWGKKEWVLPGILDEHIVSLGEGGSPLLPARRFGAEIGIPGLYVKCCGTSHTGSFKDLGMTVLVSAVADMIARGVPIRAVACASTGDTSAALAAYCAAAGVPSVVLLPKGKITTAQLLQPLAHGAIVLALDTDFDGCMAVVSELTTDGSIYLANSMNPLRLEGQKTAAIEIAQQLGWQVPDFLVVPGGNLGNVYAFGRGFQLLRDLGLTDRVPRLVCAQAEKANPLFRSYERGFHEFEPIEAGATQATAIRIGNPVSAPRAIRILQETHGIVGQASEDELSNAAARADRTGLFCDPHTGVALAVAERLASEGVIRPEHRVVVVSTAHALKFTEHKVGYHEGRLDGVDSRHRNSPIELEADADLVRDAVRRAVEDRFGRA
jgi:threonine synthase